MTGTTQRVPAARVRTASLFGPAVERFRFQRYAHLPALAFPALFFPAHSTRAARKATSSRSLPVAVLAVAADGCCSSALLPCE